RQETAANRRKRHRAAGGPPSARRAGRRAPIRPAAALCGKLSFGGEAVMAFPAERTGETIYVVRVEYLNGNRHYFAFTDEEDAREFRGRVRETGFGQIKRAVDFSVPMYRLIPKDEDWPRLPPGSPPTGTWSRPPGTPSRVW